MDLVSRASFSKIGQNTGFVIVPKRKIKIFTSVII